VQVWDILNALLQKERGYGGAYVKHVTKQMMLKRQKVNTAHIALQSTYFKELLIYVKFTNFRSSL